MADSNYILSLLDKYLEENPDDISKSIAKDFRRRRIEKNWSRQYVATQSGIPVSNIVRFEQTGLISLKNLIAIAITLGYTTEVKNIFNEPKFSTMEELDKIRRASTRKRVYTK